MDIVNDIMKGASESYDSLFGGEEGKKSSKYIAIFVIVAIVIFVIVLLLVFLYYRNKNPFGGNRLNAGGHGCCNRDIQQARRSTLLEAEFDTFEEFRDNNDRFGPYSSRFNTHDLSAVPFNSGSGYDNVMQQPFTSSKPDGQQYNGLALNPMSHEAVIKQKAPLPRFQRPYLGEEAFVNFAGSA